MEKVLLGLSGGVDSAWACRVLQSQGYEVEGLFLSLHKNASSEEAELSAARLGIKLHIADYSDVFEKEVVDFFVSEYEKGRTPNPCVVCNRKIKFSSLLSEADRLGIYYVSTGHYVKVGKSDSRFYLRTAADFKKDQSYFLWQLTQEQLSRYVSPLCDAEKREVIEEATKQSLVKSAEESQEICFIPDDDYIAFLKSRLSEGEFSSAFRKGSFVSTDGRILGQHNGIACYTVGQRKGLGVALGKPAFVIEIRPDTNEVVLGFEEENRQNKFTVHSLNFVSVEAFEGKIKCFVRPRYRSPLISAEVTVDKGIAFVETEDLIKKASPGQSAVFYDSDGNLMFGGYVS